MILRNLGTFKAILVVSVVLNLFLGLLVWTGLQTQIKANQDRDLHKKNFEILNDWKNCLNSKKTYTTESFKEEFVLISDMAKCSE